MSDVSANITVVPIQYWCPCVQNNKQLAMHIFFYRQVDIVQYNYASNNLSLKLLKHIKIFDHVKKQPKLQHTSVSSNFAYFVYRIS